MELGNITAFGLLLLIINGGVQWIREWKKFRIVNTNGDDLKAIKLSLNAIDKKVGETNVAVNAQKEQCGKTVTRFDKTIADQNQEIIKLAGRKR